MYQSRINLKSTIINETTLLRMLTFDEERAVMMNELSSPSTSKATAYAVKAFKGKQFRRKCENI